MLRRAFAPSIPNALSSVALLFVLSGACAEAVMEDDATRDAVGGSASPPSTGGAPTQSPTGGTGATTGAPSGGTPAATGGSSSPVTGGTTSTTGGKAGNPFGGGNDETGGRGSGGSAPAATGGTTSKATGGSSSKATGGASSDTGGAIGSGGEAPSTGGKAAATGGSGSGGGECDFSSAACEELDCKSACPTNMGTYCATACQAVIDCLELQPSCPTLESCVERSASGTAAACTQQWEMAGGASTMKGSPAAVISDFFDCACGAPDDTSSGSGGAP